MSDDIPPHWMPYLQRRGLISYRKIAEKAEFSHETARRVITGRRVTEGTVARFAVAVGIDPDLVWELRGQNPPDRSRAWEPPAGSESLTDDEREVLSRLIALMTRERRERGSDGPSPMTTGPQGEDEAFVTADAPVVVPDEDPEPGSGERGRRPSPGRSPRRRRG